MCALPAILIVDREPPPLAWADWLRVCGGFAILGLVLWLVVFLVGGRKPAPTAPRRHRLFLATLGLALPLVGISLLLSATGQFGATPSHLLTLASGTALIGVAAPFVLDLTRLRPRRLGAIAWLSIMEAIRRKVLWAYLVLVVVFLFAGWFIPYKPEDQVRTYIHVIFWTMSPLLLVTAGLLAATAIPADIQNQTMVTLLTKPVERFEIVLGRLLGHVALMTVVLFALGGISLLYVLRGVDPDAAFESLRARQPLYGQLVFERGGRRDFSGEQSLREWDYRRYIAGGRASSHRAVWLFTDLPADLAGRPSVPCEYAFGIFRLSRPVDEEKGIGCALTFRTWRWHPSREAAYRQERDRHGLTPEVLDRLAETYGIYEESRVVTNKRTFASVVPGGLFRNALSNLPSEGLAGPLLEIEVRCLEAGQYLGVARHDLYLLDDDGFFASNFLKGLVGLWCRLCLVIGVAVACSTYLNGLVAWLSSLVVFGLGLLLDYLTELARGTNVGGGPFEAFLRLSRGDYTTPLDLTPTTRVVSGADEVYRWFVRYVVLPAVPDVERWSWTQYVAEGFDIPAGLILPALVALAGYLLPWLVLAYYLMKVREISA
ncbi:MAG: ABC transporter permease [Gemmataceae bacterium]|nr:ABC transporter permease [Gemmataceae bacterium]MDW8265556.1 hypothetical protein [Gemmataceae bacterium]